MVRLWGRAAWCARGRLPAREIATREPAARSGRSRSPARPRRRPRAPQSGRADQAAGCLKPVSPLLMCGCVGLKPASPLRAPAERRLKPPSPLLACACVGVKPRSPLRGLAEPRLKPSSPLRAPAERRLKPSSPLRVGNGHFWCVFRVQRRCRFQGSLVGGEQRRCRFQGFLVGGEQRCCWFQRRHVVSPRARKSSPCALKMAQNRRFLARGASFFAEELLEGRCWASFFAPTAPAPVLDAAPRTSGWLRWGGCSIRSWLAACRRRVVPLMTPFPRCVVLRLRREGVDASIVLFSAVGEADARRIW